MSQTSTSGRAKRDTRIKKDEPIRKKALTRATELAIHSDASDSEPQTANTSRFSLGSTGEGTLQSLSTLPATANRLYQEAKVQAEQLENSKTDVKEVILNNLAALYEIVLRLSESRQTLQLQLEKARNQTTLQLLGKEREYSGRLIELAEGVKSSDVRSPVSEILTEVKSLRQLIVFDVLDQLGNQQPQATIQSDMQSTIQQLQETSSTLMHVIEENKKQATYAEKTAGSKARFASPQANHTIIVSSKDEKDTSEDVLKKIRGAADARSTGVKVERIRKAKNQKVVISCESKDSLTQLKKQLKTNGQLNIDEAKNKDPLIVIQNVLAYNTDEEIVASIKTQNKEALREVREEDYRVVAKYRKKARNPHECHIVLQVSPKVWQNLTSLGRVRIDLQRCPVYDQSPLVQCTRCLGYGHSRKLCKETADRCSHCAGIHLRADCPSWGINDIACCRNCHAAKIEKTEHNAFDRDCPIRKKWDIIARSSVSYC